MTAQVRSCWLIALALLLPRIAAGEELFRFDATLRVDLHRSGDHRSEGFMLDELRREGAWPSSRVNLVDPSNQGCTVVEAYSPPARGTLVFRQGYCSLFGEWQTTDEAKTTRRTFSETVRLPMPRSPIRLVLKSRDRKNALRAVFEATLDPGSLAVSQERRHGGLVVHRLRGTGPIETSLDVTILGDGYQDWQMSKFQGDAARFAEVLLRTPPFADLRDRINLWAVESPSRESGVDEPRKGIYRDTALSMSFNTFGSSRYLMTTDNKAVRDIAANAPYDALFIISNSSRYGGGGVFNLYASLVSDNEYDDYLLTHEFGHSFAGLGDEYYTSSTAYNDMYPRGMEPWEPNITAQKKLGGLKWRDLVEPGTPIPTPAIDPRYQDKVGLFEGAGYAAKGLYRPAVDCKMFDKGHKPYCPVCLRSVRRWIEWYLR